jgi:hypothetical protein
VAGGAGLRDTFLKSMAVLVWFRRSTSPITAENGNACPDRTSSARPVRQSVNDSAAAGMMVKAPGGRQPMDLRNLAGGAGSRDSNVMIPEMDSRFRLHWTCSVRFDHIVSNHPSWRPLPLRSWWCEQRGHPVSQSGRDCSARIPDTLGSSGSFGLRGKITDTLGLRKQPNRTRGFPDSVRMSSRQRQWVAWRFT